VSGLAAAVPLALVMVVPMMAVEAEGVEVRLHE